MLAIVSAASVSAQVSPCRTIQRDTYQPDDSTVCGQRCCMSSAVRHRPKSRELTNASQDNTRGHPTCKSAPRRLNLPPNTASHQLQLPSSVHDNMLASCGHLRACRSALAMVRRAVAGLPGRRGWKTQRECRPCWTPAPTVPCRPSCSPPRPCAGTRDMLRCQEKLERLTLSVCIQRMRERLCCTCSQSTCSSRQNRVIGVHLSMVRTAQMYALSNS